MNAFNWSLVLDNSNLILNLTKFGSGERLLVRYKTWLFNKGTVKDYYIAYSLDYSKLKHGFPTKVFYWCSSSNYIFATLPAPLEKFKKELTELNVFFSGEHDRIVIDAPATAQIVIDEDEEIIIPSKSVTELNRLSQVVY